MQVGPPVSGSEWPGAVPEAQLTSLEGGHLGPGSGWHWPCIVGALLAWDLVGSFPLLARHVVWRSLPTGSAQLARLLASSSSSVGRGLGLPLGRTQQGAGPRLLVSRTREAKSLCRRVQINKNQQVEEFIKITLKK